MQSALIPIFASALAVGAIFTAALGSQPGFRLVQSEQQVINPEALDSDPGYPLMPHFGSGRLPDYVLGTDFARLGSSPMIEPATYEPPASTVEAQALADASRQLAEVSITDDQGRRQIDDLSHRPDPATQLSEAGVQRTRFDRSVEFDHAGRAANPDVDDAGRGPAGLEANP